MGTPTRKTVNLNSAEMREIQAKIRQADIDMKTLKAYRDGLVARIKRRMGDAEELKIDGVLAFTNVGTKGFAWAKFIEQHGDIAEPFKVTVTKETYDFDKIEAEHPALVEPFRTYQFLVK